MATTTPSAALPRRPRAIGWSRLPVWLRRAILLGLVIAVWWRWPAPPGIENADIVTATPLQTLEALVDGIGDGALLSATWSTLRLLLLGVGIGALIAMGFTLFATLSKIGEDLLGSLTAVMNPLPGVAILPLALLWFGLSTKAILFVIANATIWPIAINITTGFRTANPTIVAVGRNIGLSRVRVVSDVLAPAALPHAISGLKAAWAFGWRTVVAAELVFGVVGGTAGLGIYLNDARNNLQTPQIYAGLVVIAILGVLFEALFDLLERRTIVRWGMKSS